MLSHSRLRLPSVVVLVVVFGLLLPTLWVFNVQASGLGLQTEPTPTVDACAPPTVVRTATAVSVRTGPGEAYRLLEAWRGDDARPVVGRHGFYEWWQIELSDGSTGWVWDGGVEVRGDIASVPLVTPPGEDPAATANLAPWEPVPSAECVATPITNTIEIAATPTASAGTPVAGLDENDDGWSPPVNLSQSGLATAPQMVTDATGVTHVLWQEEGLDRFVYTREVEGGWLEPRVIPLPFALGSAFEVPGEPLTFAAPVLATDSTNIIHAFWIDAEGALMYSRVAADAFESLNAWTTPVLLASSGLAPAVAVSSDDTIHLSYIRPTESESTPPGIFYRAAAAGGNWSDPLALYSSRYLRALTVEAANLEIEASREGDQTTVYVAWTDPVLEKVFFTRSENSGQSWEEAMVVDERQLGDRSEISGPSNVILDSRGSTVLLLWQAGHGQEVCQQWFKSSSDRGATWEDATAILGQFVTCPSTSQLLAEGTGPILLLSIVEGQPYLLAWDGERWSDPQLQEALAAFVNPETFRTVRVECYRAQHQNDQLIVVGCGVDRGTDIWSTERAVQDVEQWFDATKGWVEPELIASSDTPFSELQLLAVADGQLHAFWNQPETGSQNTAIFYSGWDGIRWTPPEAILRSPAGNAGAPTIVQLPDNQYFAAWASDDGQIYGSRARLGEQLTLFQARDWSSPRPLLPAAVKEVYAPAVVVDAASGIIHLVFAVRINESRGLYKMTSEDQGNSWSDVDQLFDARAAGWEAVGAPKISVSGNGTLDILWAQQRLQGNGKLTSESLHAARLDGISPTMEVQTVAEAEAIWYDVASFRGGIVHQFWQEASSRGTLLWHRQSTDGANSWSVPTIPSSIAGTPAMAQDEAGGVHLLQLSDKLLEHWKWEGAEPVTNETARLNSLGLVEDAAAALSSVAKTLYVIGTQATESPESLTTEYGLFALGGPIEIRPTGEVALPPPTTPASSPTPATTPTPTVTAAPLSPLAPDSSDGGSGLSTILSSTSRETRILLSLLPVGLLILLLVVMRSAGVVGKRR